MAYRARIASTIIITAAVAIAMSGGSDGRELRPSDHGLAYQESPPPGRNRSPEMQSFFAGDGRSGSSPSSNVALPKALNSNDTSWWSGVRGSGDGEGGGGRDHMRHVLVVASVACGITGVALLLASAFIYLFRYRKQKKSSSPSSATSLPPLNDNNSK